MIVETLLFALAAAAEPGNLCTLCHPEIRVEFERSIHRSEEVSCVSCHGGDATAGSVEAAHRGSFRGGIGRREVPALCAACHSDPDQMSPYNLPTDQNALYQNSQHGRRLKRGDERVAVCTDCHGVHEILRTDDPRSAVFPANIPGTCAGCHSDPVLGVEFGWPGDPYADFIAGRHGAALLERQDASAPSCSRCHGSHGATPAGVGDINKICGQCHRNARAYFLVGPHRDGMREAGLPECSSCHGKHRIGKADVDLLEGVCRECHEPGSEPVELGLRMKTLFTTAANDIERARGVMERAAAIPLHVEDYRARLEEANTSLIESLPVMHSLDLAAVEDLTGRARSIGHEVESEVLGKLEGRKWRQVGLVVFWLYLLVTLATLFRFRHRAARESGR